MQKLITELACDTRHRKNLILNLAGITVLDAIGIGILATFIGKCSESGIKLVWCAARQRVKDKLLVSKLIYVVPYYQTEKEALDSLS
jgi:anti-anti-sigma factor